MYYYVVCAVRGRFIQETITGTRNFRIIDRDLVRASRERMMNTIAVARRVVQHLDNRDIAGVTVRKVLGSVRMGEYERMILAGDIV